MQRFLATLVILNVLFIVSCSRSHYSGPLTPEKALGSFQLNKDFDIELYAAEPFVLDPVEMVFDEQNNAYVVEMPDYPYKPESGKAAGQIRVLSDTNGDGRIDKSVIFADSLSMATSILPWKGGLLVTAAPDIFYLKDTNGDFKADTKEVLFSGFFDSNSEAQITNLQFSVDNWIYAANNGQNGKVKFSRKPDAPELSMAGVDFRFRLDRNQFEQETGTAQFGQSIDDWGKRLFTQNSVHIQEPIIPWRYLHRHPYLPPTITASTSISDHNELMYQLNLPAYWRAERSKRRNETFKENHLDKVEYAEGHFTGVAGLTIYTGEAFPDKYYGSVFTGDVSANLVHMDLLNSPNDSLTYIAKRDGEDQNKEFLASTDTWFRPVNFTVGPDGFLYIIDIYRQHIETPVSIPDDLKEEMDFMNGSKQGRIYRIVPKNHGAAKKIPANLKNMASLELVDLLTRSSQWWRLGAQRLLLERQDKSVVPAITKLFAENKDPRVRLNALYVLEGLNSLDAKIIQQAMKDPHPGVRESAMILAEQYPECLAQLIECTSDSSARVAFQASLSLGQFFSKPVISALARVVEKHENDYWFRMGVLSSEAGSSPDLIASLLSDGLYFKEVNPQRIEFLKDLSYVIGARNKGDQIERYLNLLSAAEIRNDSRWQVAGLAGLTRGIEKSNNKIKANPRLKLALQNMASNDKKEIKEAINGISKWIE
jgi:putative membrane-bound dehydrogenase-like protein